MSAAAYEPVIGLEVHVELLTQSKMFCACPVVDTSSAEPNSAVCEVCTGMPGTLPVVNARAVEFALRAALALHCQVAETSLFARKNYFYPDLPKGYQISQYELPLAQRGWLDIDTASDTRRVRIRRVHLEEDTGKLLHRQGASLVDYNRSGVPLLEVVTEPDLYSLDDVKGCSLALRSLLRYLDITTGDMEKGAIRFEANISLRPRGSAALGTRTEIKNLNSFRAMLRALEYEIERQAHTLARGGQVHQETLRWDEVRGVTCPERGKEEADDYRYFPEPDLPPLRVEQAWLQQIGASLPELPSAKRSRFVEQYRLTPYSAGVLTAERAVADYFEACAAAAPDVPPAKLANWLSGDLFALLNEHALPIEACKVAPPQLAELVRMVEQGKLTATSAKAVLGEAFATGDSPAAIVTRRGLLQLSNRAEIDRLVQQVVAAHPEQVEQYLQGKAAIAEWLLGQVMRAAGGRANPTLVRHSLQQALQALEESRRSR